MIFRLDQSRANITGASGLLGRAVVKRFEAKGDQGRLCFLVSIFFGSQGVNDPQLMYQ